MEKHSLCVFGPGGLSIPTLRAVLNDPEYGGDDVTLTVLRSGDNFFLRIANAAGDGPPDINDSHLCPGSPGC